MDKALDMGKSSATGSFQLLIGVAGSTVIMAVGTLILGWILSRDQLGLYGIALIPSSMINFFRDWGVNSAMTKQIASLRARNKEAEIHDVIISGIVFEVLSGAALSLLCFGLADLLASYLNIPGNSLLISIFSLQIFAGAVLAGANAIFVGFENMKLNSFTTILSAIVKTALGPFLVVIGLGVVGAVVGTTLSVVAGGAVGILTVYLLMFRPLRKIHLGKCDVLANLKDMLRFGMPLTVSNIVVGVLPQVFAFVMAPYAGVSLMGDYYAAVYFTVLLTFFSIPISTALFPAFAKLNPEKEPELLKTVFASSVKYTSLLLVPATLVVIALSGPMVNTLFPNKFPNAPIFLALSVIINLYAIVGNISLGTLLTGIGQTNQLMKQSLLSLGVGLPIAFGLVPFAGVTLGPLYAVVFGVVGTLVATAPGMVWGLYWIWRTYGAKTDFVSSAKIIVSSSLAAIVTYLFLSVFVAASWLMLFAGFFVFMVLYLLSAPLIGAVNQADVNNFRNMFSGIALVSKILEIPLRFVEIPLKLRSQESMGENV